MSTPNRARLNRSDALARLERLRAGLADRGLAGALVIGRSFYDRPGNVAYLTHHFPPFPASMSWGESRSLGHAALIVPAAADPVLVYDTTCRKDVVAVGDCRPSRDIPAAIADVLTEKDLHQARIGLVGEDIMSLQMHREILARTPDLALEPADDLLIDMRMTKSPGEIQLLRQAAAVADIGFAAAFDAVRPGAKESDVCAAATGAMLQAGADFVRYVRVHSGPYSAWGSRWPQAMDRVMQAGELVTIDIVGAVQGHQFDVLRSGVVGRRATPDQRRQLDTVLRATQAAVAAARPGVLAEDVVQAANRVIEDAGFGAYARPFIGHGIGWETMEPPFLMPGDKTPLRPGMVLCVEPAINIPGVGGASIEEEIVVTDGEPDVLTRFPPVQWE